VAKCPSVVFYSRRASRRYENSEYFKGGNIMAENNKTVPDKETEERCEVCGEVICKGDKYCNNCGTRQGCPEA